MTEPVTWVCVICGWIYDEAKGSPEHGIASGTPWGSSSAHARCPECGARHEDFEEVQA